MITTEQKQLIEKAVQAKEENPNYIPSKEELQAIDAYLLQQAKRAILHDDQINSGEEHDD